MNYLELVKTGSIYHIILNRPEKKNALNIEMIDQLSKVFIDLEKDDGCQMIVIKGAGDIFCAGADLSWMQKQIDQTFEDNLKESNILFDMFLNLSMITKPVVSYVHKFVMGGAIGLVACSDYCFAEEDTKFCFSETRFGLAPAVISPFVLAKCSPAIEKQMLFAEYFHSKNALDMGLVHAVADQKVLNEQFNTFIKFMGSLDLNSVRETKKLILKIRQNNFENYRKETTHLISKLRIETEAQNRLREFLETNKK